MVDKKILTDELQIECPMCYDESDLKNWEEITLKQCITREMRRKYTSLHELKAYTPRIGACYKCPVCGKWLRGCELILKDSEGNTIKGLGSHKLKIGIPRNTYK